MAADAVVVRAARRGLPRGRRALPQVVKRALPRVAAQAGRFRVSILDEVRLHEARLHGERVATKDRAAVLVVRDGARASSRCRLRRKPSSQRRVGLRSLAPAWRPLRRRALLVCSEAGRQSMRSLGSLAVVVVVAASVSTRLRRHRSRGVAGRFVGGRSCQAPWVDEQDPWDTPKFPLDD